MTTKCTVFQFFKLIRSILALVILALAVAPALAQDIVINEIMALNSTTIEDEDEDYPDWLELYNRGDAPVNLENYAVTDDPDLEDFWIFPSYELAPGQSLLVFASDKDRTAPPVHWETVIDLGDEWRYILPTEEIEGWIETGFDDSGWQEGKSSFGYGDDDDSTVVANTISIFIRTTFDVADPEEVAAAVLHMDYDDGFVAFVNGVEVARSGLNSVGVPGYNAAADSREARMYDGGDPERFLIQNIGDLLVAGENVLAIQVHNTSAGSSDLSAIPFLSLGKHAAPEGKVSTHLDLVPTGFHTNFKLSTDGEKIYLRNNLGELIDSVFTGELIADISYGRKPDGENNWLFFTDATPGEPNDTDGYGAFAGEVAYSHDGGLYSDEFQLTLSSNNPEDSIYYSLDGSDPVNSGTLYVEPVTVNATKIIRARVIKYNALPGPAATNTYLFNREHELPVILISTDPDNFFDHNEGIYVDGPNPSPEPPHLGANYWQEWEKPVHIEMYEPDGSLAFSEPAGVEIFGGYSRSNPQKSLAIHFRNSYGTGDIDYRLFPDMALDEFSHFVLRTSANDWNYSMFRDALHTSLFHEVVDKQAYRPSVVYINGEYWGIHNIREKVNEDYLASHHGLDPDDINILENNGTVVEGDNEHYWNMIGYMESADLSDDTHFEHIADQMDVFNFIQYQIGQIYVHNTDWPGNNIKYWRGSQPEDKWRWIVYDTDFGFGLYDYNGKVGENTLAFALEPNNTSWPNPAWSTFIFRSLLENENFKNQFINAFADRLNTVYQPAHVKAQIKKFADQIRSEIPTHFSRWGQNASRWQANIDDMNKFADNRPAYVKQHIRSEFGISGMYTLTVEVANSAHGDVKLNTLIPDDYPWSGEYFNDIPVSLEATPKPGYRFVRWEGDVKSTQQTLSTGFSANATVKAVFELADSELAAIVINEINYNASDDFDTEDWVELHNKSEEAVDISGWVLKDDDDAHEFIFPDNTVIEAGGFLVVCRDQEAFSALHTSVSDYLGDMDFGLSSGGDCVRLFTDAMELSDQVCFEGGAPWPDGANGEGATLALINPAYDNEDAENWYALFSHGSPGESNAILNSVDDKESEQLKVYPNPFQDQLTVRYSLSKPGDVVLQIYNSNGQLVATPWTGSKGVGEHEFVWNAASQVQGIYFIKLVSAEGVKVSRAISIK